MATAEPSPLVDLGPVMSIDKWPTNGELIRDCARLGYLRSDWKTLDPTWGYGTFWKLWRPLDLVASDIDPDKSPVGYSVDFTDMPWSSASMRCVVFDPPYKLNGNPSDTDGADERYGVHVYTDWRDRMKLILAGVDECARVLGDGYLLVKCQDQVCSGKKRWQTDAITHRAERWGLGKVDRLDIMSYRPQPEGRSQRHARQCSSQLLVFKRGW